jgi:hypothetical protein
LQLARRSSANCQRPLSELRKDWIASLSLSSGRPLRAEPVGSQ